MTDEEWPALPTTKPQCAVEVVHDVWAKARLRKHQFDAEDEDFVFL
jgi:hypothetical protein